MEDLKRAIEIARAFKPMSTDELKTLSSRLKTVAGDGRYEHFKTTQRFDAGYHRKQHGFSV
jgi:hypothetical protein